MIGARVLLGRNSTNANPSQPFNNVNRILNVMAENDAYNLIFQGPILPFDQGQHVKGAEEHVMAGTNHCTIASARCDILDLGSTTIPLPMGRDLPPEERVNQDTYRLIADFLKK